MAVAASAKSILAQLNDETTKLGDLRKIALTIKKDHELAMLLRQSKRFLARQLAFNYG